MTFDMIHVYSPKKNPKTCVLKFARFQGRLKEFLGILDEDLTIQLRDAKKNLEEVQREEKDVGSRARNALEELSG